MSDDPVHGSVHGMVRPGMRINVTGGGLDIRPEPWMAKSLCVQTDPEAFYVEKGGSTTPAKTVCLGCEVREQCLQYALDRDERFGVWGGYSERERRRLNRGEVVALMKPSEPRRRPGEAKVHVRTCAQCGAEFGGHPHAKYCGLDCKRAVERRRHNDSRRKGRTKKDAA